MSRFSLPLPPEPPLSAPPKGRWRGRALLLALIVVPVGLLGASLWSGQDGRALLTHVASLQDWVGDNRVIAAGVFFAGYTVAVCLGIPGAVWLTMLGGMLFGPWLGCSLVLLAATLGALGVFFLASLGRRESGFGSDRVMVRGRLMPWGRSLAEALRRNVFWTLLFLRLMPVFPFWLVNLLPALVGVRWPVYTVTTLLGILPGTVIYTWLGVNLGGLVQAGELPDAEMLKTWTLWAPLAALLALMATQVGVTRGIRWYQHRGGSA